MPRVSLSEVQTFIPTTVNVSEDITAANLLINRHLAGSTATDDEKRQIELRLASHLACVRDPRVREAAAEGGIRVIYERGRVGSGLHSTGFGEQVVLLDPTGFLEKAMSGKKATFKVY